MTMANALAYYDTATIKAVKIVIVQTPVACTINIATIVNYIARGVIYDHSIVPILYKYYDRKF